MNVTLGLVLSSGMVRKCWSTAGTTTIHWSKNSPPQPSATIPLPPPHPTPHETFHKGFVAQWEHIWRVSRCVRRGWGSVPREFHLLMSTYFQCKVRGRLQLILDTLIQHVRGMSRYTRYPSSGIFDTRQHLFCSLSVGTVYNCLLLNGPLDLVARLR